MRYIWKRCFAALLAVALVFALLPGTARAVSSTPFENNGGTGQKDSPYLISTAAQLKSFRDYVNKKNNCDGLYFQLTENINLNGSDNDQWTPIGGIGKSYAFQGTFDGNGHTISGLNINNSNVRQGLFSQVGENGTVKNLTVGGIVTAGVNSAVIVGRNKGTVENCHNTGKISGTGYPGGVVGDNESIGTVKNCYNTGDISGVAYLGGVVGDNDGTVTNCYYLSGTADEGIGHGNGDGTVAKTETEFNSGEVAWLLQGNQEPQVWGQKVGTGYPELTGSADKAVYKVAFMANNEEHAAKYANLNGTVTLPESNPTKMGLTFKGWSKTGSGTDDFDASTHVSADTTVYAVWEIDLLSSGTAENPYLIPDLETLKVFRDYVNAGNNCENKFFKLTNNIDLGGEQNPWTPIGGDSPQFQGTFNGDNHTISGLNITSGNNAGLFGIIGNSGTVKNLTVKGSVTGAQNVGGIVGHSFGNIENCHNAASIKGSSYTGGIVGYMEGTASVQNCSNTGTVNAGSSRGGIAGNVTGTIRNCYNAGEVTGTSNSAGGIAGFLANNSTVENCYNVGKITGSSIGGVVGNNRGTVQSCYNYGAVTGSGGPVRGTSSGQCINCFYLDTWVNDGRGAVAKSAEQFASGEVAYLLQQDQDSKVWGQTVGSGYPELTDNIDKAVYKITGKVEGQNDVVWYTNNKATLPAAPVKSGFTFAGWSTKQGGSVNFDKDSPVSKDMTVYAVWKVPFEGSGTEVDPYIIPDKATLEAFRDYVNAGKGDGEYFKLTNNIDLNGGEGNEWTPIGGSGYEFRGTFDGDGHTISGLFISSGSSVGLFGCLGESGTVKNLTVEGNVAGISSVGGIVGQNNGGTINGCHNAAAVTSIETAGGIVGFSNGTVTNCYNTGAVTSTSGSNFGGIVGHVTYGSVTNCYNTATVTGNYGDYSVGGIIGFNSSCTVTNCYYLSGTATGGIGGDGEATEKTAEEFASGEVAYLLQNAQDTSDPQVWGQKVGSGNPELTDDPAKKVYQITGKVEEQEDIVWYSNSKATLPTAPEKDGNTFSGWSTTEGGEVDFAEGADVTTDMTVYAVFKEAPSSVPPSPSTTVDTPVTDTDSGETTVTVNTRSTTSGTTANASVSNGYMSRAVDSAVTEAARRGTAPVVEVDVRTSSRADSLNVTLPTDPLEELAEAEDSSLVIVSDIADVTLDNTALSALAAQATGNTVILEVKPVAPSELSEAQAEAVGEDPVEDVSVVSNGVVIHDYHGGRITVTLPYKLAEGQSASDVVVYYLDDAGTLTPCDTSYDSKAEKVTFVTVHLSRYVIGDTALGEEKDCPSEKFTDLDAGAWYHDYTDYVIDHGLMHGVGGGLFDPNGIVTRAQMATVLWNMRGKPVVNYYMTYSDVSEDAWYAEAIRWATSEGIAGGYGNGKFGPDDPITREQMAVMLYRYEQKYGDGGFTGDWMYRLPFADLDQIFDWAFEAVAWCNMKGVITGKDDDLFDPKGPAKRSEMAAILTRYCEPGAAAEGSENTKE